MQTTQGLEVGTVMPEFSLPDTEGNIHRGPLEPAPPATVITFTCNHCPYVVAWNPRLRRVAEDYQPQGVRFVQINANDASSYPADSYEHMQEFVKAQSWPIPYLHDESQTTAQAFDAQVTPHVFVFDHLNHLVYRGAPDSDHHDDSQNAQWLRDALDSVLSNSPVEAEVTEAQGCSIKWKY